MSWTWEWPECPDGPLSQDDTAVVFKVNERWGGLSNMSNDYPLVVNGIRIGSSEALYQACRFPHRPDWQKEILDAPHAMAAKMASKKEARRRHHSRPDFDLVRVEIMRWCLRLKLAHNWHTFGRLLCSTSPLAIVERSRSDDFWGAKVVRHCENTVRGANTLGRLLIDLREQCATREEYELLVTDPPKIDDFLLLNQRIRRIDMRRSVAFVTIPEKLSAQQIRSIEDIVRKPAHAAILRLTEIRYVLGNRCADLLNGACEARDVPTIEVDGRDEEAVLRALLQPSNTLIVAMDNHDVEQMASDLSIRAIDFARRGGSNIVFLYPDGEWDVEIDD